MAYFCQRKEEKPMNQNDMDRYFWRTGHRWSGDHRRLDSGRNGWRLSKRPILLLAAAFDVTWVLLLLLGNGR
jgi:hypothetical protein